MAQQVSKGTVNASVSVSGSDGALLDGVDGAIKATVKDYTSSNPLAVVTVDTNGDYVAGGAGTQYTEDAAASANPVGSALILIREDARAGSLTNVDGDNVAARGNNKGELYVKHTDSVAITAASVLDVQLEEQLDYDTGGGTVAVSLVGVALPASGGPVAGGTATNPLRVDPTGTTTQPVSLASVPSHAVTNAGTFATQAAQSGTWTVQPGNTANTTAWKVDGSAVTQPVSAASLPLPTGAATLAKQPALGTAGAASPDVITVQGVAAMTALKVDGSGVTQPVSLSTVAVTNAGTFATQATLQAGTNAIGKLAANSGVDIGDIDVTSIVPGTGATNLGKAEDAGHSTGDVGVMALAVRSDSDASLAGTDLDYSPLQLDASGYLKVNIKAGAGSGGTAIADDAAFTVASTSITPVGGTYKSVLDSVDDGDAGAFHMTVKRAMHVNLRDASGAEVSVGGGTQYDEDAASAGAEKLTLAGAVRRDTAASSSTTDGDYSTINTDASGRLWVNNSGVTQPVSAASLPLPTGASTEATLAAVAASLSVMDDWDETNRVAVNLIAGQGGVAADVGVTGSTTQRVVLASDVALPAGTNAIGKLAANSGVDIGDVDVTSVPTDPFGANADAASATGSISAKLKFIASTGIPVTGTVTVGSHAVTNAGTFAVQAATAGDVAHDGADSGNPVKVGGKATSAEPTAVASGDRANFITDLVGKLITLPYSNPENFVSGAITTAMTGTTRTSLVAAPAAGLRNYITTIIVSNAHATVGTDVTINDGDTTTVLMTIPAAAVYGGATITLPVPLRQPTTATALYCANVTTGASTKVSAVGYKGA